MEMGTPGRPICEWGREEILTATSAVELVLAACADLADSKGESVNFRLEWLRDNGTPIAHCAHRQSPIENADGSPPLPREAIDADLSPGRLIARLLQALEAKDRVMMGAIGAVFAPLEHTIRLQGQINEQQGRQLLALHQQLQVLRETSGQEIEASEEARTEALARAAAWNKFSEVGPLALVAFLENIGGNRGSAASGSNGGGH
jgi:hypothetical protein